MAEKESGVTMPTKDETGCVEESLEGGAAAEEVRDARQGGVIPVSGRPPPHHPRQSRIRQYGLILQGWPLRETDSDRLIIHLREIPEAQLREGGCYFFIRSPDVASGSLRVVLRQKIHGLVQEHPVLECGYLELFAMDWMHNLNTKTSSDLAALLSHCMVAAEEGISRMSLDSVKLSVINHHGNRPVEGHHGDKKETPAEVSKLKISSMVFHPKINDNEARAVHRVAEDGSLVRADAPPPCDEKLDLPLSVTGIATDVLNSGIAIYPGCCDCQGSRVICVLCKHEGWDKVTPRELARLLLYCSSIPREEVQNKGFTLIVDARGTTLPILNALLETIYMVQANAADAISIVHVLADRVAQSLLFRSPVFRPQVDIKIDLVTTVETLYKFVDPQRLPRELGGQLNHNHNYWIAFRLTFDPFMMRCRQAAEYLVSVMTELAKTEGMPRTVEDTKTQIDQHEGLVHRALDDERLRTLQKEGDDVMNRLQEMEPRLGQSEDYREAMADAYLLMQQVQETMMRLVKLADGRLLRLQQCLQLRQFEQQSSQVIGWLTTEGEQQLVRHADVSDNLKTIRQQQKDFDKLYFTAMTHIEKGNDMLEEASLLTQSGNFDEVTGIKEITRELKTRVRTFTSRLDDLKDKIETTAQCYHMLDQSYEWALEATRYVSTMKMENVTTPEGLAKLTTSLDLYLREHPAFTEATFDSMLELASKLGNDKLLEQCKVAKSRCLETSHLLRLRQHALRKAKNQLEKEERRRASLVSAMSHSGHTFGPDFNGPVWQPKSDVVFSVQSMVALRRRSYAGQPSSPMYSPAVQAFRDGIRDVNLTEYEEQLFSEGLITEDMSDRIVTCLPKGLSSSTLRNSRESLRGSKESLRGSCENLTREQKSNSVPRDLSTSLPKEYEAGQSVQEAVREGGNKPHHKLMRRTNSVLTGAEGEVLDHQDADGRKGKTLSMISGSSESLPSMPEEDEMDAAAGTESNGLRKFVWSPVPVNTHLSRQHRSLPSYHSMADLRMTDEEMKRRRTLELIMNEMITTERNYVKSIGFVIEHYMPELMREDVPQALRGKRNIVFGNIEQIYAFHSQYFLAALEQCELTPFQICHCFLQHAQEFYLYALYNKNKPKSDALMSEYGSKFFRQKQIELGDRMDLNSYLLKPVQRMGKYALLLKQILKECPEAEQEYADLKSALEMVKFQLRHGNDLLVMDSLRDCDVNLQEQGRLLRQDEFLVWTGRRKCLRRVFLFEELILFSKTKRSASGHDVYVYKNAIKTADIGLTETVGDSTYKFEIWFRRRTDGATHTLQAPTIEIKQAWVREASRLLWKQAIKNRELRLHEMARMGIGNKPCLDLKQSKDNINDRFVNVTPTNRVPRSRNSIAVSSFDHLKNGNKRPHSIISVSSTSSSSSSQSSGPGIFGPLGSNLETNYETPNRNSKTYTICSNESGIIADISGSTTPPASMTDSCTQTTLKRPPRPKRLSSSGASSVSLTTGSSQTTSSHMLSTDV